MPAVVPQKPIMLSSKVERRFMPKMPATIAPNAAEKLPMLRVSSNRFTCAQACGGLSAHGAGRLTPPHD